VKVRRALALTVLPIIALASLITSSSPAVAANHSSAGTYQLFVQGQPFGTVVLGPNHGVTPYDTASWGIQKGVVTITSYLGPVLSPATCHRYRQSFPCGLSVTFSGRKTSVGIASRSAPGLYTINVNSTVIKRRNFYAVRTGGVRPASQ
jgi:hypothetical protein